MKMKKYLIMAMVALTGVFSSCEYDDEELWNSVNNLVDRVAALETLTNKMNSDIAAVQTIVTALEKQLQVTEVEELADGYIIHFSDGTQADIKTALNSGMLTIEEAKLHGVGFIEKSKNLCEY